MADTRSIWSGHLWPLCFPYWSQRPAPFRCQCTGSEWLWCHRIARDDHALSDRILGLVCMATESLWPAHFRPSTLIRPKCNCPTRGRHRIASCSQTMVSLKCLRAPTIWCPPVTLNHRCWWHWHNHCSSLCCTMPIDSVCIEIKREKKRNENRRVCDCQKVNSLGFFLLVRIWIFSYLIYMLIIKKKSSMCVCNWIYRGGGTPRRWSAHISPWICEKYMAIWFVETHIRWVCCCTKALTIV